MISCFREGKLTALQRPTSIGDILFDLLVEKDKKVPLHKFWTVRTRKLAILQIMYYM